MNPDSAWNGRHTVLVVAHATDDLSLLGTVLGELYEVVLADNAEKALRIAADSPQPDLILLDVLLPDMDGFAACRRLKSNQTSREIPVILLSGAKGMSEEGLGLETGAVDFIIKPISIPIVLARVKTQLQLKAAADFLRDKDAFIERIIERRTLEVRTIQEVMMLSLALLAETGDNGTGNHVLRIQGYIKTLAGELRTHPRFRPFLTAYNIEILRLSAPLHDLGKVGIPDRILLKPGSFEPGEYEIMKTHTTLGRDAIEKAERTLGRKAEVLRISKEIAYSHHEKWDGTGYPERLAGDDIPIPARLMALADVYDAIISKRAYKEPVPHERAVQIIRACRGSQFDPDIVDAFLLIQDKFKEMAGMYSDSH